MGVLVSSCKGVKLAAARAALLMPPSNRQALESAYAFMARVAQIDVLLCPCCKLGRLRSIAVLVGQRGLPAPGSRATPYLSAGGRHDALAQRNKSAAVCWAI